MQKQLITLSFSLLALNPFFAQVQGNFKQRNAVPSVQEMYSNISFNQAAPLTRPQSPSGATIVADNVVEFRINALSNQKADAYTAIFNVVQLGKTAEETHSALKSRLDAFVAEMKLAGVKPEDIYIDMVNFLPKFEYDVSKKLFSKKTFTEIPIGFELQKNIHVRFEKAEVLDRIVEAAAKNEIYDIVKVDYFVKDTKKIYAQLREQALLYFKEIRQSYKSIQNLDSAYVSTGENTWVSYPGDRYTSYQAYSAQSLDPTQRADAKVERVDKPVSQFYNAIPANDYDIVINPEIVEPCVQFSFQLVVRCTLNERKAYLKVEREKEFILVTPTGEVKTLTIEK